MAHDNNNSIYAITTPDGNTYQIHDTKAAHNLEDLGVAASAAEINYLSGVTSNVQTQLNNRYTKSEVVSLSFITTYDINNIWNPNISGCCFVPGTQVMVSLDGATKSIETLHKGDTVVSYNIHTGENYEAVVNKLIINNNTTDIAEVHFDNGTILQMNAYHPIYTENGFHSITRYNGYDELVVGDNCRTVNGWSNITDIVRYETDPIITYNLDVVDNEENPDNEENDTFFANGVVVHNATTCPT